MCTVSMIGDDWARRIPGSYPWAVPGGIPMTPGMAPSRLIQPVGRVEFETLKREVQQLRELLLAAKKYDEATGQPDCEVEDKVALIRRIAELVGVDMSAVFPTEPRP